MTARRWSSALVTGASSGIGAAIARQLAAEGTDLVIVARDLGRLEAVRDELVAAHRIDVEVLRGDLADAADLARVEARVAEVDRPLHLVVNNAGYGTSGRFWELPIDGEADEIALNVVAVVRLTHAALGAMVARGGGAVLNVASVAGMVASPGAATYGATKAFVCSFGDSVHEELAGTGVTLTTVLPGFTRTEFQERANVSDEIDLRVPGFMWSTPDEVARAALDGTAAGRARVVPGRVYQAASALLDSLPSGVVRRLSGAATRRS
jgi:short-subunit dehydrogenase